MTTEDYVSFETAKLLKEKGFDGECHAFYRKTLLNNKIIDKAELHISTHLSLTNSNLQDKLYKEIVYCVAPTLQMAMKWLREVHKLSVRPRYDEVEDEKEHLYYVWFFDILSMNPYKTLVEPVQGYSTYEEVCEAGIRYCLENLI